MKNELYTLLEQETYSNADLKSCIENMIEADIAEVLERIDDKAVTLRLFKLLSKDIAAEVFTYLSAESQENLLNSMSDKEISHIVGELFIDDAVDMLEEMPANVVQRVLKNADETTRRTLNEFLNYPEDSAGSLMTIEYVHLNGEMTVMEAFDRIKKVGIDKETIYTCYVVAKDKKLEGVVSVKALLLAKPNEKIESIMETNVISCTTHDDRETVAETVKKYNFGTIPVVDKENRLVGIITVDDILSAIVEAHTEDIEIMAGMSPSEKPYLETGVSSMVAKRVVWLIVLLVSGFLTGLVMQGYEEKLKLFTVLAFSVPMLMGTGGNGGAQSSTLIIRSLALKELSPKDTLKVLWKEFRIAVIIGLCLVPICFAKVMLIDRGSALIALTVSLALFFTLIVSKTIGCLLPMAAVKLKIDPAVMAAPLITTIVDISSLLIYFSLASLLVF